MKASLHRPLALALFVAVLASPAIADEQADRNAAVTAATDKAQQWLHAMDEGRYDEGWKESAEVVKEGRTEQGWIQEVSGPRQALGKPVMRELKQAQFTTQVRGAPQGEYVVAVYLTKFTNIPLAMETILLSHEDNDWRIGGYSIAEAPPGGLSTPGPGSPPAASPPAPAAQPKPKE
jgi:hypothetical protein